MLEVEAEFDVFDMGCVVNLIRDAQPVSDLGCEAVVIYQRVLWV